MAHVPASERRPQLVQAAIELMAREGVAAASTRAVAAELGVAQATVHYTFGTKRDLYRAVLETSNAEFLAQIRDSFPEHGPFEEQVRALAHTLWTKTIAEPGYCIMLTEFESMAMRDPELQQIMRGVQQEIESTAAEILAALAAAHGEELAMDPRELAVHFLAGFDGLSGRYLMVRDADGAAEQEALRALDVLVTSTLRLCRNGTA